MQIYLAFKYFLKVILRRFRKTFKLIPSVPFQALIDFDENFNSENKAPEILYLGDSVVERVAEQDTDQRTLGRMVIDKLAPEFTTAVVSFSAYHISVYYALLRGFKVIKKRPKILILPINIRSFSPQWDLQPKWQYREELLALEAYYTSGSKTIRKLFDDRYFSPEYIQKKYRDLKVQYPLSSLSTIGQFLDVIASKPNNEEDQYFRKQQIFIFNYGYPLAIEHQKLLDLRRTLSLLFDLGIKVFVYVTPVNVDAGVRYVGLKLKEQISENIRILEKVLSPYSGNENYAYSDWCLEFPSEFFFHDDLATEHLNQNGRLKLAKLISDKVKDF